jgi:hypothetical protein
LGLIKSLAQAIGIKSTANPVKACLSGLDRKTGQESSTTPVIGFQYFPEQIQDIQSARYSERDVPGGSHPILQYLGGGSRTLSFTAFFTQEQNPESASNSLLTGLLTGTAEFGIPQDRNDTVDVASAIRWLRSYIAPNYETGGLMKAPPVAILYLPNSGIIGHDKFKDSVTCVMTQCDVTYEAFHRNGSPRIVAVSLSFTETMQVGNADSGWQFQGSETFWTNQARESLLKSKAMQGRAGPKSKNLADRLTGFGS